MTEPSESISNDALLYRRIIPSWITWEDGKPRPTSEAFKDRREYKLSVVIASECSPKRLLRGRPEDSVISIRVSAVRDLGLRVERDFDRDLPGHAVIFPAPKSAKARTLAQRADWVQFRDPRSRMFAIKAWIRKAARRLLPVKTD